MTTPSITAAQIAAVLGWIGAQLVAYNLIGPQTEQLAVSASATILAAAWKLADAHIRNGRSRALTAAPAAVQPNGIEKAALVVAQALAAKPPAA